MGRCILKYGGPFVCWDGQQFAAELAELNRG
jgi:hypothetical protein